MSPLAIRDIGFYISMPCFAGDVPFAVRHRAILEPAIGDIGF